MSSFYVSSLSTDLRSWRITPWLSVKWPHQMKALTHVWLKTWLESQKHLPRSLSTVSKPTTHPISYIFFFSYSFCKASASNLTWEQILSCRVTNYPDSDFHLAISRPSFHHFASGCFSSQDSTDRRNYLPVFTLSSISLTSLRSYNFCNSIFLLTTIYIWNCSDLPPTNLCSYVLYKLGWACEAKAFMTHLSFAQTGPYSVQYIHQCCNGTVGDTDCEDART